MIKRGVGWSRRPPMHVGSRDAGARRPRVLNPMCIGLHRHAGYARIRRWRGSEDVWGCGMGGPSSPPGRHPHASARVWVFVECLVNRHVSHPFHTHTLRINYIAGLQRRRKYTQPGNAIANPLYFDTQRETALLGIPPLSFVVALGSRYWLGRAERGRDHASLAAHL